MVNGCSSASRSSGEIIVSAGHRTVLTPYASWFHHAISRTSSDMVRARLIVSKDSAVSPGFEANMQIVCEAKDHVRQEARPLLYQRPFSKLT
jgi:hypothetical protein